LDLKHIVIYSEKYAVRSKIKREQLLAKAADLIANPGKYKRSTSHGAAGYVNDIVFNKKTGEIIDSGKALSLNVEKIIDTLRQVECSHIEQNYWLFDFANEVTDDINTVFGTNIGVKIMTLGEIKKNLGIVKKGKLYNKF
jgi:hypothetical protein